MALKGTVRQFLTPLSAVAFTSGFSLMVFELVAARLLAPSIGSSTYVWTSVIGVIMLSLSIGYYAGGKLADVRHRATDVALLCFAAAFLVVLVMYFYQPILELIMMTGVGRRMQGVIAALVLFAPTSVVLGMISPYLMKLHITSLKTSGQSVARLSMMNAIGSIAGTFVTGFILFGVMGSLETLMVVVLMLVMSGWLMATESPRTVKIAMSVALVFMALGAVITPHAQAIDTPTAHYQLHEYTNKNHQRVRGITSGPGGIQSGMYIDQPDELVFWYTRQMAEVVAAASQKQSVLVLGGGTYTLPRYLAQAYPNMKIDVVEIDPGLTDVARRYFAYNDPPNVSLHYDDARAFINESQRTYDIILVDVYSDMNVPFSLLTKEYGQRISGLLADDGVVVVNAIVTPQGKCRPLYQAIHGTYRSVHGVYYERAEHPPGVLGNMIMVYSRRELHLPEYRRASVQSGAQFTDNYMPAEALQELCQA